MYMHMDVPSSEKHPITGSINILYSNETSQQWFDIKISLCNIGPLSTPVRSSMG